MLAFLKRDVPAVGRVLFPGPLPPTLEGFRCFGEPFQCTQLTAGPEATWHIRVEHPEWGTAEFAALRSAPALPDMAVDHTLSLTPEEKRRARSGETSVAVRVNAQHKHVLRDRKRLLFWLKVLMDDGGVIAEDGASSLLWSREMLDDEFQHRADLDIESLYVIHAVQNPQNPERVYWLHTHGLGELRAIDVDVLRPSPLFVSNCADPLRALAYAGLEGVLQPDTDRFTLAYPGGDVRLVAASRFQIEASEEHRSLRDAEAQHEGRRSVLCEPVGGLFGRWRKQPIPSRFAAEVDGDGFVVMFSTAATELMAERARQTLNVFSSMKEEFSSLSLPCIMKLGYPVDGGGPDEREHLWFEVHEVHNDKVDATLANTPHRVSSLRAGERREHSLEKLTDWTIITPEGQITPRNHAAARRLRQTRDMWQERLQAASATSR